MREDQTQLFEMSYATRCDTFGCGETGAYFVGRPDGPLNTCHVLCQICTDSLIESIKGLVETDKPVPSEIVFELDSIAIKADEITIEPAPIDWKTRLAEAKTHTQLDGIIDELALEGIPDRENAKLQQRKDLILAAAE